MDKSLNKVIKSHLLLTVLSGFAVVLLMSGVTYALFQTEHKNSENQVISVGNLDASLSSTSGTISISDIYPKNSSDLAEGENTYSFTISNTGTYDLEYTIYLSNNTAEFVSNNSSYSDYTVMGTAYYEYINYRMDNETAPKT